jgi:cell division protein ZapA (FtsZ GTPase activity inhibitor)
MSTGEPNVVTVMIAGEAYTLRAQATPEYTRQCAQYLDGLIRDIRQQAGALEMERVAILAGLALVDQLFQARDSADQVQGGTLDRLTDLTAEIRARLAESDLASTS